MEKLWFTLRDITYDKVTRRLEGVSTDGVYLGLMAAYLPPEMDDTDLTDGVTVRILAGPGMTMSLPPQLMGVTRAEIVKQEEQ